MCSTLTALTGYKNYGRTISVWNKYVKKQKKAKDCTVMPFHTKKGQKRPSTVIVSSFFKTIVWRSHLSLQNKDTKHTRKIKKLLSVLCGISESDGGFSKPNTPAIPCRQVEFWDRSSLYFFSRECWRICMVNTVLFSLLGCNKRQTDRADPSPWPLQSRSPFTSQSRCSFMHRPLWMFRRS